MVLVIYLAFTFRPSGPHTLISPMPCNADGSNLCVSGTPTVSSTALVKHYALQPSSSPQSSGIPAAANCTSCQVQHCYVTTRLHTTTAVLPSQHSRSHNVPLGAAHANTVCACTASTIPGITLSKTLLSNLKANTICGLRLTSIFTAVRLATSPEHAATSPRYDLRSKTLKPRPTSTYFAPLVTVGNFQQCSEFDAANLACPIAGYASIVTMPLSLFCATIYSEAFWDKVWASQSERILKRGALLGCIPVILVVFISGFGGLLASWANLIEYGGNGSAVTNGNLYLFQIIDGGMLPDNQYVHNRIGVVLVILSCALSAGAIDSIQTGMALCLTSYVKPMVQSWTVAKTRVLVLFLNIMLISIAAWQISTASVTLNELFLLTNLLCTGSSFQMLIGLSVNLRQYFGGGSFTFSIFFPIFCLSWYGVTYYYKNFPDGFMDPYNPGREYIGGDFGSAMFYTWIGNNYSWDFFLVPFGVSIGCVMLSIGANVIIEKCGFLWPSVPGFTASATHPELYPTCQSRVPIQRDEEAFAPVVDVCSTRTMISSTTASL